MKKLLFVLFFLSGCILAPAQHTNAAYLVAHPINIGGGVRFDQNWSDGGNTRCGAYASFIAGSYHHLNDTHINQHYKTAVGYIYYLPLQLEGVRPSATVGVCYSVYRGVSENVVKKWMHPVSLEIGAGVNTEHLVYGLRFDVLTHEVCLDLGFKFNLIHLH